MNLFFLVICSFISVIAEARIYDHKTSLLRDPGPSNTTIYISPVKHTGELLGPIPRTAFDIPIRYTSQRENERQGAKAEWYVAQWNNPSPIDTGVIQHTNFTPAASSALCKGKAEWSVSTPSSCVCANPVGTSTSNSPRGAVDETNFTGEKGISFDLISNGSSLKCGTEFDMFISPLDGAYPSYKPSNIIVNTDRAKNTSLANFRKMSVEFDITIRKIDISSRCGVSPQCSGSPDYAYIPLGLVLGNPVKRQTIFYQIILFDSRWNQCEGEKKMCEASPKTHPMPMQWYFKKLPTLGVSIPAPFFSSSTPCIKGPHPDGPLAHYRFDNVLPSFKEVISYASKQYGADGDISRWVMTGMYLGSGIQGETFLDVELGAINVEVLW